MYRELVDGRRAMLGEEHPDTVDALDSLAVSYLVSGSYDDAIEGNDAITIVRCSLSNLHGTVTRCLTAGSSSGLSGSFYQRIFCRKRTPPASAWYSPPANPRFS